MKTLITATAVLMLFASAASAQDRTQDYRMWSAEQMINRIAVIKTNPTMPNNIREAAASGDDALWAKVVDIVHQLELDTARAELKAAREQQDATDEAKRSKYDLQRARQYSDSLRWR